MRTALTILIITLTFSGCDSIGKVKSENPVLGPPPPRMHTGKEAKSHSDAHANTSEIKLVSNQEESADSFRGNHVIAIVNGDPVFASEITDQLSYQMSNFEQMVEQGKVTPEQFTQLRKELCKKQLPHVIKQHVLLTEMKKSLSEESQEELNKQLEEGFSNHIEGLKQRNNVQTRYELEKILAEQHVNLADLKYLITNAELSKFYEHSRKKDPQSITRAELITEYQATKDSYRVEGKVKWQRISVNYAQPSGKSEALEIIEEIIKKLGAGDSFEDLAREYSDGPTASQGGNWDWMQPESLSEVVIVDSLKTLPEGKISQVIEGKNQYHLVRVLKRIKTHTKPFESVQEKIKKELIKKRSDEALTQVYEELRAQADVHTVFDEEDKQESIPLKREMPLPFK